jgi:hypothetical protein
VHYRLELLVAALVVREQQQPVHVRVVEVVVVIQPAEEEVPVLLGLSPIRPPALQVLMEYFVPSSSSLPYAVMFVPFPFHVTDSQAATAVRAEPLYQQLLQEYLCAFVPHIPLDGDGHSHGLGATSSSAVSGVSGVGGSGAMIGSSAGSGATSSIPSAALLEHSDSFLLILAEFWLSQNNVNVTPYAEDFMTPTSQLLLSIKRVLLHVLADPTIQQAHFQRNNPR